ncbi:hypothetical protein CH63R_10083 [Colletotrichum higginsianum IMI 349063]|uniref:Stc1 domain-containing protein n=1 Tax=Colletotrichum higginsianum (strain IMI 349063) TaxID=759273 RepID=A0A1B7Y1S9_COLHI|nr:uncharacterized protein CH63R_10083 [Colletotrichum higginsianum IMI 349063]OBR05963.1 hypothetical protein CH63R_10083 [Colletotrichum higginsianum IMI 349063]
MSAITPRPNGSPHNPGQKLPEKFRCKTGGEWKPLSSFSNKQQKLVLDKLGRRVRIDAANTGMNCRFHSGEPVKELQCEGPCSQILVLDQFSKNNRTNGVNICKACQHWINTQEPGYAPWAGPHTDLDPIEQMGDFEARMPAEPSDIVEFHDNRPLAPITGTDGLTALDNDETGLPSLGMAGLHIGHARRGLFAPRLDTKSISTPQTTESVSSQAMTESMGATEWWFTQSGLARDQTGGRVIYNAWDSTGQKHELCKTPTVQSEQSSMMNSIAEASNSRSPNATDIRSQKTAIAKTPTTGGGTWAGNRQADRKQLSEKEHRELQRNMPQRQAIVPYGDYSDDSDDDE